MSQIGFVCVQLFVFVFLQADLHLDVTAAQQLQQETNVVLQQQQQQQQQPVDGAGVVVPVGENVNSTVLAVSSSTVTPPTEDTSQQATRDR